jgi:hypothetical protein
LPSSFTNVAKRASYALPRALIMMSTDRRILSSCVRAISRSRRLSRFRLTFVNPYFGTMKPTRGWSRGEARIRTSR